MGRMRTATSSYTFNMKALTAEEQARVDGRTASVGTSIDDGYSVLYESDRTVSAQLLDGIQQYFEKGVDLDGNSTSGYAFLAVQTP